MDFVVQMVLVYVLMDSMVINVKYVININLILMYIFMSEIIINYIQIDNNCYINNCLNQGICIDNITYFTCNCSNGYSGTLCQNCLFYSYYFHYYLKF